MCREVYYYWSNEGKNIFAWRVKATEVMLDIPAEARESSRMLLPTDLALERFAKSNLPQNEIEDEINTFSLMIAEALFAACDIEAERAKMEATGTPSSPKLWRRLISYENLSPSDISILRCIRFYFCNCRDCLSCAGPRD